MESNNLLSKNKLKKLVKIATQDNAEKDSYRGKLDHWKHVHTFRGQRHFHHLLRLHVSSLVAKSR